jgi:putative transposase
MSALPQQLEQAPSVQPPPRGVQWIDLSTAAQRSGRSEGQLRRRCQDEWSRAGVAEKRNPGDGRKATWFIREDADAALARVPAGRHQAFDESPLTDAQRRELNRKLAIVQQWQAAWRAGFELGFNKDRVTNHFLERLLIEQNVRLSRATLYNWLKGYEASGKAGLVDSRWKTAAADDEAEAPDPFLAFVREMWLSPRKPRLTSCHEAACFKAEQQGWRVQHYKTCQRMINAIPAAVRIRYREGAKAFTDKAEPFIERDYTTLRSNEVWCGDHHQLDLIITHEGKHCRPWLTAWQDVRSRKIVGWHLFAGDPNQDTIVLAFRAGVIEHGVPEHVLIDNGKDYDAFALQGMTKMQRRKLRVTYDAAQVGGLFGGLGVGVTHCEPYHGQSKPIERWFRELSEVFAKTFVTYTGNCPDNKPEDLAAHLKRGEAPTLDEVRGAFIPWLATFHGRAHRGDGMDGRSPDQVFAACLQTKRTAPAALLDLLLMKTGKPVRVAQNGVTLGGIHYGQYEPELAQLLGKMVQLRHDPADLSRVAVFDEAGRRICVAEANRRLPFKADHALARQAIADKRHARRVVNEASQVRMRLVEDQTDLMIRASIERNKKAGTDKVDPTLPPPAVKPVQAAVDDHFQTFQRAIEQRSTGRRAAGAESMTLADIGRAIESQQTPSPDDDGEDDTDTLGQLSRAMRERAGRGDDGDER